MKMVKIILKELSNVQGALADAENAQVEINAMIARQDSIKHMMANVNLAMMNAEYANLLLHAKNAKAVII